MSEKKKHHNHEHGKKGVNPFATDENDVKAENTNAEETKVDETPEMTKERASANESEEKDEKTPEKKKGVFDGLFGKDEIAKLKAENEELKNRYLRLAADFENFRKRQATERESLIKYGMEEMFKKMIEICDNFDRAKKALEKSDSAESMKEAFEVLHKQFTESLKKLGLEEIDAEGKQFDPNLHEAVMQTPSDEHPEETILNELQKGYKYANKVLRPSMVNVSVKQ